MQLAGRRRSGAHEANSGNGGDLGLYEVKGGHPFDSREEAMQSEGRLLPLDSQL